MTPSQPPFGPPTNCRDFAKPPRSKALSEETFVFYQPTYQIGYYAEDRHIFEGPNYASLEEAKTWFNPAKNQVLADQIEDYDFEKDESDSFYPWNFRVSTYQFRLPVNGQPQQPTIQTVWESIRFAPEFAKFVYPAK